LCLFASLDYLRCRTPNAVTVNTFTANVFRTGIFDKALMKRIVAVLGCALWLAACPAVAQQQDHPEAPSASKEQSGQLPDNPQPQQQPTFPKPSEPTRPPESEPDSAQPAPTSPAQTNPATPVRRSEGDDSRDQMFKIAVTVNQVFIPVTVKDTDGHLVEGLLRKDFSVVENGVQQNINFFTSDPFPLSAAVVLDTKMSDAEMKKVSETMGALSGAFSAFDEVAFYTYGNSVRRELDYSAMSDRFSAALRRIKPKGETPGAPVMSGPMGPQGPMINGIPVDPSQRHVYTPPRESYVLNDAILAAAHDLAKRERTRRKIIFVLSDGKESDSRAAFDEVRKVLLSNEITVYGVGLDEGALPVYRTAAKIHVPYTTYGNILGRYARDTGGDVFAEIDRSAIEAAYQRVTNTARNQYTIGYKAKAPASGTYRSIEVKVHRGGLVVQAKPGYFPLPPGS
jgi:VWFA-related protein